MSKAEDACVGPALLSPDLPLDRLVLPVREGVQPGGRPPVRIFLGTESAQYRADRVLVWSIEKVRDPARVYEITLLKDLPGFDRRGWTTSFTNYRFAIPHLLGGRGRAIYNDEDQIYLRDPAELFDLDLEDCGYRAVSALDTSVMLLDAAKMATVWTLAQSQSLSKKALLSRARSVPGLFGELDGAWNVRDQEGSREFAACLHFTTLHTQPWRPFPERFVYDRHPDEDLWFDLEREANEAGFRLFRRETPSRSFSQVVAKREAAVRSFGPGLTAPAASEAQAAIRRLAELTGSRDVLEIADGAVPLLADRQTGWDLAGGMGSVALDEFLKTPLRTEADAVVCLGGLDTLPQDDVGWVLDECFRSARRFVYARVRVQPPAAPAGRGGPPPGTAGTAAWWRYLFETAAARWPDVHWELAVEGDPRFSPGSGSTLSGGSFPGSGPPCVWALSEEGDPDACVESLAEALGWPFERVVVPTPRSVLPLRPGAVGLPADLEARLAKLPPDLVLSRGPRLAAVSRGLQLATLGRTRVVHFGPGYRGSDPADTFDLHVVSRSARSFAHPNRVEVLGPLVAAPAPSASATPRVDSATPRPRVVLLVGGLGGSPSFVAKLYKDVAHWVRDRGGSLYVATAGSLPAGGGDVFGSLLEESIERTSVSAGERGIDRFLELADIFVVTGDDEALLARACGTGRPVLIYPGPPTQSGWVRAVGRGLRERVVRGARARPLNRRGTTRPQKWGELRCSRWIARGWVRPDTRPELVQRALVAGHHAGFFGDPVPESFEVLDEAAGVVARIRSMLGVAPLSRPEAARAAAGAGRNEVLSSERRV